MGKGGPDLASYRMPSPAAKPYGLAIALIANAAAWLAFALLGGFTIFEAHALTKIDEGKTLGQREPRYHSVLKDDFVHRSKTEAVP
jgi:uncharacterized protein (DUF1810 family)